LNFWLLFFQEKSNGTLDKFNNLIKNQKKGAPQRIIILKIPWETHLKFQYKNFLCLKNKIYKFTFSIQPSGASTSPV
jgi:hypothetical protein